MLIIKYCPEKGAVGFVLNKFNGKIYLDSNDSIACGGPLKPGSTHVLHDNSLIEGCERVTDGLYVGGKMTPRPNNTKYVIVKGYSAWDSLQLDGEVRSGLWEIEDVSNVHDILASKS